MSLQPGARYGAPGPQTLQLDVGRLQTLRALLRFEAHFLVFSQRLEAVGANFGEVSEEVVAAVVGRDEAKALLSLNHLTIPVSMKIP